MSLRRGSNVALTAAAVCVVGASIKFAAPFLVPVVLAGFIATVTAPFVLWCMDRRVPRWLAVGFGVSLDVFVLAVLGLLIGGAMNGFFDKAPEYQERAMAFVEATSANLEAHGIPVTTRSLLEVVDPAWLMGTVSELMRRFASLVSQLVLVLLIVVFMLIEATGLRGKLMKVLKDEKDIERLADGTVEIKKYVVVKTGTSAATGLLGGLWCFTLSIDLPVFWGLAAFLLNFIPSVGSIIAGVLVMTFALLTAGWGPMLGVGAGFLAINFVIGNGVEPRLMGQALGLSPMVVFLSVVVWGWFLGPVGALLSAPLTMMIRQWLAATEDLAWVAVLLGPSPLSPGRASLRPPKEDRRHAEDEPPPNEPQIPPPAPVPREGA